MIKRTQQSKWVSLLQNILSSACVVAVIAHIYQVIAGHWPPVALLGGLAGGSIGSWFQRDSKKRVGKNLPSDMSRPEGQL